MKIALLGIGAMHFRIAQNLLHKGYELFIYNRTPKACEELVALGAVHCDSPYLATTQADVIISMVTNNEASSAIWLTPKHGAIHGLNSNKIAIECSTLSIEFCSSLAVKLQETGAQFIDAPVLGSRPQADQGQLIYLLGGDPQAIEKVRPVLEVTGKLLLHVGNQGDGMKLKLVVNTLFALQLAAASELLGVLEKSDLSIHQVVPLLEQLPITSPVLSTSLNLMAQGKFAPMFPVNLVEKDLGYMEKFANGQNAQATLTKQTRSLYQHAQAIGLGSENFTSIIKAFTEVEVSNLKAST